MTDFIKVDTKEIDILIFKLRKKMPKEVDGVIRSYVNELGFQTKKNANKVMDQKFNFANNSTKNFTKRGVFVQKAKRGEQTPTSEVGATGDLKGTSLKARKASYLARQEMGGTVTQLRAGNSGTRKQLIAPNPKHAKRRSMKMKGKAAFPKKKTVDKKHALASAIASARKQGKKFAFSPYGIYRVLKRSAKLMYIYKPKDSIKTPKRPWLQPSVKMTMAKREAIFRSKTIRMFSELRKKGKF